jgi:hypothetical protein
MSGISERNPFVGPRPIQQGEPLYGRDAEVRELYNRLQARRHRRAALAVGRGQELARAGRADPAARRRRLRRVEADPRQPRPGGLGASPAGTNRYLLSAMISLEDELPPSGAARPSWRGSTSASIWRVARGARAAGTSPVVLIFDQFEEVLTVAPLAVDAKRAFFTAVGAGARGRRSTGRCS